MLGFLAVRSCWVDLGSILIDVSRPVPVPPSCFGEPGQRSGMRMLIVARPAGVRRDGDRRGGVNERRGENLVS